MRQGVNGGKRRRPWLRSLLVTGLAVLLAALVLLNGGPAMALNPPWSRSARDAAKGISPSGRPPQASSLQEVDPPLAVQQLQAALSGHQPVVEILSPRDDSLLNGEPWSLRLRLHDWPLVDAGPLGYGPHLRVQIDQEPPLIWTGLEGTLPPLSPGSHRISVYAALPWGEAIKSPGALQQIRLHRAAANPLSLPAPGTPQLLPVSPSGQVGAEPLLLDWLLLDAPLQNLRGSASQWRLRAQINGDSVLLDQQTPLWLRGWKPGSNALLLELLDGRGEPLNPPFNSLVLEVNRTGTAPRPRWLGDRLSAQELAVLLGQAPPEPEPAPVAVPADRAATAATAEAAPAPATAHAPATAVAPAGRSETTLKVDDQDAAAAAAPTARQDSARQDPAQQDTARQETAGAEPLTTEPTAKGPASVAPPAASPAALPERALSRGPASTEPDASPPSGGESEIRRNPPAPVAAPAVATRSPEPAPEPPPTSLSGASAGQADPATAVDLDRASSSSAAGNDLGAGTPVASQPAAPTPPLTPAAPGQERITTSSSLHGRARDLVNADGTLRKPPAESPLDKLRGWLQR